MARKPKYQGKPTFNFNTGNMIIKIPRRPYLRVEIGEHRVPSTGLMIAVYDLHNYLTAAKESDGQLEEALTLLISAMEEVGVQ